MFGICDTKTRERLLREPVLTLKSIDVICHAAESMTSQLKLVDGSVEKSVSALSQGTKSTNTSSLPSNRGIQECHNCGRNHETKRRGQCPAFGKVCRKYRKLNHFAVKCRSQGGPLGIRSVKTSQTGTGETGEEIFSLQGSVHGRDNSQFVTLRFDSGCYVRFQVDTGAQCNVIPLDIYNKATVDASLTKITPSRTQVTAYGGNNLPVVGTVLLKVQQSGLRCRLDCKSIDHSGIRPLLGRKACLGIKIITYLDNDHLTQPATGNATVCELEPPKLVSIEQFISKYASVFVSGVGLLDGRYHIVLDETVTPVQHSPWRVPIPLRDAVKSTLDNLVLQNILAPAQKPTPWKSSMVVFLRKMANTASV